MIEKFFKGQLVATLTVLAVLGSVPAMADTEILSEYSSQYGKNGVKLVPTLTLEVTAVDEEQPIAFYNYIAPDSLKSLSGTVYADPITACKNKLNGIEADLKRKEHTILAKVECALDDNNNDQATGLIVYK